MTSLLGSMTGSEFQFDCFLEIKLKNHLFEIRVGDKRYFECQGKHGSFLRPNKVVVGDYPEIDEFEDMDEI